jgi:beta-lactam-binding protein with PASTA domain
MDMIPIFIFWFLFISISCWVVIESEYLYPSTLSMFPYVFYKQGEDTFNPVKSDSPDTEALCIVFEKKNELLEMPCLIHMQVQCAQCILVGRGLRYVIKYRASSEENGSVIEQLYKGQRIKDGMRISVGAVITLIVGQNDMGEPILTPDLIGRSYFESMSILNSLGVSYMFLCSDCSSLEDSLAARVILQSPEFISDSLTIPKSTPFTITLRKNIEEVIENQD